ncbi:hypothetical protein MVEN_00092500 [Mycena venus]|uniref:Uncharacterized protein n=1 Tax=Mycena venus TaxID=2733690 RepID=A0A8H6Z4S8_9AGAR|nr:hypothetical protein MVEN_00092500 [Mycena venus]
MDPPLQHVASKPPPYTAALPMTTNAPRPVASAVYPATPFVSIPPPDVSLAACKDGHLVFPSNGAANAILQDVPGATAAAHADAWAAIDEKRVAAFLRRQQKPNVKAPREPCDAEPMKVGVWLGIEIETCMGCGTASPATMGPAPTGRSQRGHRAGALVADMCAFEMTNFQWSHGANWWVSHGIALGSIDEAMLESFGLSWRNHTLGNLCPHSTTFVDYATDPSCTQSLSSSDIILWENLEYPTLRPGLESAYPRKPATEATPIIPFASNIDFDFESDTRTTAPKEKRTDWSDGHNDELGPLPLFIFKPT